MYAVKSWNEEVTKWLAVGMCLAMLGMAVMPAVGVGDIGVYLLTQGDLINGGLATGGGLATLGGAMYAYATAETITTLAAVGIGLTGVGGLIVLG